MAADVNDDGLIDIFVANDMNPNFLFLNRGDGTFDDVSEISGAAYNINGKAQSGMGVDAEDVDGDGLPELFVTNFANEYNTLYQNYGKGIFFDNTAFFGLASDSMPWVKWGCALADFDNDGWPDCFIVNGHVDNNRTQIGQPVDYEEIPLLVPQRQQGQAVPPGDPRRRAVFRHQARRPRRGLRRHRQRRRHRHRGQPQGRPRRPCSATTPSRTTTGSGSSSQGTKSNRDAIGAKLEVTIEDRLENPPPSGRSTVSARGATACRRPTIRGCWWASARRAGSRRS